MLVLIAVVIGAFLWWRARRNRLRGLPRSPPNGREENIPLTESADLHDGDGDDAGAFRSRKGKERATEYTPKEEIFRVDDSDDEDTKTPRTGGR